MIDWQTNLDAEQNKIVKYKGQDLVVFSDHTKEKWKFIVNGEITESVSYNTENEAKQAAIEYVDAFL